MFLGNRLGIGRAKRLNYNPDSVSGLVAHFEADAGVNTKTARDFVSANTEYFNSSDADFDFGNESFAFGCWVKFDSVAGLSFPMSKWGNVSGDRSYAIYQSSGTIYGAISDDGAVATLASGGSVSTATWYFTVCVYDATNDLLKFSIDGGDFTVTANSNGCFASSQDFKIGAAEAGNYLDGQVDVPFVFNRAPSFAECLAIYNSGNGTAADSLGDLNGTELAVAQSFNGTDNYHQSATSISAFSADAVLVFSIWVKIAATPAGTETVISKRWGSTTLTGEYTIFISNTGKANIATRTNGTTYEIATSTGSIVNGSWNHFLAYYDYDNDQSGISLNGAAFDTLALAGKCGTENHQLTIGAQKYGASAANLLDGDVQAVSIMRSPTDSFSDIRDLFYNSGNGIEFDDLTAAQKTAIGLVSHYKLNNIEGATQTDSEGANNLTPTNTPVSTTGKVNNTTISSIETSLIDAFPFNELSGNATGINGKVLTDNNTVGSALGKVVEDVADGESVFQFLDQKGSNHLSQSTFANQPLYDTDTPRVDFNGSSHTLVADTLQASLASDTQGTWMAWLRPTDATPAANDYIISFGDTNASTFIGVGILVTTGVAFAVVSIGGVAQWRVDTDTQAFVDGTWAHFAAVHNGTQATLYINGTAVDQTFTTDVDRTKWFNDASGLDNGRLGCLNYNSAGNDFFFDGDITNILFYNTALTAAQVASLKNYNSPV